MIRIRGVAYRDEDDALDAQRDEQAEAKRAASGISPEELSLQDAYLEGVRLGMRDHGREMCVGKYDPGTPEFHECERGRMNALGLAAEREVAKRKTA